MKKFILIYTLTFVFGNIFAQDTITKRNSEKVIAKILEITPTEIKYKKFDFQDGPLYTEKKADIKMIVYANGMKEVFEEEKIIVQPKDDYVVNQEPVVSNKIDQWGQSRFRYKGRIHNEREIQDVLLQTKDKKIMSLVGNAKDAKKAQYFGFAGIPLGIGAGVLAVASLSSYNYGVDPALLTAAAACAVVAIACPIVAITLKTKRNNCNRAAVKLYNEKY